jgi:hypothetical protein
MLPPLVSECLPTWGSGKNKFAILGVEAPAWSATKTQEYLDIPSFRNATGRDPSAFEIDVIFE